MNNLRMKRFEAMESSKQSIIEKTNAQLNKAPKQKRSTSVVYYIGLAVVTCIVSFGLYSLISKQVAPTEQAAPIPQVQPEQKIIELSAVVDGQILIRDNKYYFRLDNYSLNSNEILKRYITAETLLVIDELYYEEINQTYSPQIKNDAAINATLSITNLVALNDQSYKIETLKIVHQAPVSSQQLYEIYFDEEGNINIDTRLLKNSYTMFKETYDREVLRELEPLDVFYLYEYALAQKDYETAYELIMPDAPYYKPEKEEYLKELSEGEHTKAPHPFASKKVYVHVFKSDGVTKANIVTEDEMQFFGLTESEDGIWFVNFLPMQ